MRHLLECELQMSVLLSPVSPELNDSPNLSPAGAGGTLSKLRQLKMCLVIAKCPLGGKAHGELLSQC